MREGLHLSVVNAYTSTCYSLATLLEGSTADSLASQPHHRMVAWIEESLWNWIFYVDVERLSQVSVLFLVGN